MTNRTADLARLDPEAAWQPWQPDDKQPFDQHWAGHLFRRAAFGATWDDLQEAVRAGLSATLNRLFTAGPGLADFDALMDTVAPSSNQYYSFRASGDVSAGMSAWWLHRCLHSPFPLREKATLFWHGHFATSIGKVRNPGLMKRQHLLLRQHALGHFSALTQEISKDPAMLIWLDGNSNVKGRPNENYARELFELFTLGTGHYTEKDIRESARAFTGWHTSAMPGQAGFGQPQPSPAPEFIFRANEHDDGVKTILKQTGHWNGSDVVRIALEQPACARFLVHKLYRFYVSESVAPPDRLIEPLAERFRKSDYDIADLLRTILTSRHFFSKFAFRERVKSPVEFAVDLALSVQAEGLDGPLYPSDVLASMGQILFAPPNVKGWDGGTTWLNSATLLARSNLIWQVIQGPGSPLAARTQLSALVRDHAGGDDPAKQIAFLLNLLLQPAPGEITEPARELLAQDLARPGAARDQRLREAAHTIMLLPVYQLA